MNKTKLAQQEMYDSVMGIARCLHQELKLVPNKDYIGITKQSVRVNLFKIAGINMGYLDKIVNNQRKLSAWAGLDDKQGIRIGWSKGNAIEFEIPKVYRLRLSLDQLPHPKGQRAVLGVNVKNEPIKLTFTEDTTGHMLIAGETRSGKTNTQKVVTWNLAYGTTPNDTGLILFDVAKKGLRWDSFSRSQSLLHPIVKTVDEAERVLLWAVQERLRRAESKEWAVKIFLVIDELKDLVQQSQNISRYLEDIAAKGAEFDIHLIVATQYPMIKALGEEGSLIKRNLTTRLCGRVDDSKAAYNAIGIDDTGAELLLGKGDFLLRNTYGLNRVAIAEIKDNLIGKLPRTVEVPRLELPEVGDTVNSLAGDVACASLKDYEPEQFMTALQLVASNPKIGRVKLNNKLSESNLAIADNNKANTLLKYIKNGVEYMRVQGFSVEFKSDK